MLAGGALNTRNPAHAPASAIASAAELGLRIANAKPLITPSPATNPSDTSTRFTPLVRTRMNSAAVKPSAHEPSGPDATSTPTTIAAVVCNTNFRAGGKG